MKRYDITREELQRILAQLEQALIHHQQWHSAVLRAISCKLLADKRDLAPEPYRTCLFGEWYYSNATEHLRELPEFIALGEKHKLMHLMAAQLLLEAQKVGPVNISDYDSFANALEAMRLELSALKHELESMLYNHDALTGAITRLGILPAFREQQELVKRGLQTCCIAMVDLDNFKQVNDRYGHLAGDQVLIASVHYMMKNLRSYDKVFRYGGEEFLLLMQHTELPAGYDLLERLREGLASLPIKIEGKKPVHITASFGLVLLDPNSPVETSIDRADKAMYLAKAAGRNCVKIGETTG
ncbi:MAG TPA: diguanylate cyclase [Gallionellaceae bacterium]|nr:diguanylate cyclase [Gallionellaceae bacterium]